MPKEEIAGTCSVCGRLLEAHVCAKCAGSGKVKAGLLGKRACERCRGTGRVLQCPDWLAHFTKGLPKVGGISFKPTGGAPATPVRQTCPVCKGTKGIRMPFTGQAGPCPRCKGKGWV
jgi:DnaJ-class molecular chaperone